MAETLAADPFLLSGPTLISFSGGRTSALMLRKVLDAHGGALPPDAHVLFANTGDEREETLRFVHECGSRWSVPITWLEWRDTRKQARRMQMAVDETFEVVGYNSASRAGEPFDALIDMKQALPNWQARWCTGYLKVKPMHAYMAAIGLTEYVELIGLRADEPSRIGDMVERNERDKRHCTAPLGKAGITKRDVMAYWAQQPFDLGLRDGEGNCTLCFLKGRGLKKALISDRPAVAKRWIGRERRIGATFDRRDSVEKLAVEVRKAPTLWNEVGPEEFDVECGLACPAEAA